MKTTLLILTLLGVLIGVVFYIDSLVSRLPESNRFKKFWNEHICTNTDIEL